MAELAIENLTLRFGGLTVLDEISFIVSFWRVAGTGRSERGR